MSSPRLLRLRVENLALIEQAEIELGPGLNVLTGETGAGKTMLARALEALLGAKTTKGMVRPGASAAYIEASFSVPEVLQGEGELGELLADSDGELVLARRIAAEGRSRCLVNGRTVSLDTLSALAGRLIAFYGQHEGRRLMMEQAQVELLDRSGDRRGAALHTAYLTARATARAAQRSLDELLAAQQSAGRELELARFELEELLDLDPQPGEEAQLLSELEQLSGATKARQACAAAHQVLDGEHSAGELAGQAARLLDQAGPALQQHTERLAALQDGLSELAGELQHIAETWEADPERQSEIEQRLAAMSRLARKHGVGADELSEVADQLQQQVQAADLGPQRLQQAEQQAEQAWDAAEQAAAALSRWRGKQAPRLAQAISATLGELAMEGAVFEVQLEALEGERLERLQQQGAEQVIFWLQANPGLPGEPLAQVASGGEVSRLMLALVAEAGLDDAALLVLDEPDSGLGGQTAHGVAHRLMSLAEHQQVLVISHLPQIAARAQHHFCLLKRSDGRSTSTSIEVLVGDEQILDELCRMSGHEPEDQDARRAMARLRRAA